MSRLIYFVGHYYDFYISDSQRQVASLTVGLLTHTLMVIRKCQETAQCSVLNGVKYLYFYTLFTDE